MTSGWSGMDNQAITEPRLLVLPKRPAGERFEGLYEAAPDKTVRLRDIPSRRKHHNDALDRALVALEHNAGERRSNHAGAGGGRAAGDGKNIAAADDVRVAGIEIHDRHQQILVTADCAPESRSFSALCARF